MEPADTMTLGGRTTRLPGLTGALGAILAAAFCACAFSQPVGTRPSPDKGLDLVEHGGEQIPLNLVFVDSQNKPAPLANWFDDGRPVVLALLYYRCPVVCTVMMERMLESFNGLNYEIGKEFNVVFVSIDDRESPTIALAKKNELLADYVFGAGDSVSSNWAFLTGDAESIASLADAIGYQYKRMPNGEFVHPIAFAIISPEGTISRYMYGYEYPPKQMKLALLDASEGKVAKSIADRVLHFCFRYDPNEGAYTLQAMQVMRLAAVATLLFLVVMIGGFLLVERRRKKTRNKTHQAGSQSPNLSNKVADAIGTKMGHES
jgi:protein SCO1